VVGQNLEAYSYSSDHRTFHETALIEFYAHFCLLDSMAKTCVMPRVLTAVGFAVTLSIDTNNY